MLIVDGQKLSHQAFSDLFGIDLKKIKKQPSFAVDKSQIFKDLANGGVSKVNQGTFLRAQFFTEHPQKKVPVTVIYAESERPETVGNTVVTRHDPRYVSIQGEKFSFQDNLDLALWLFLHPNNKFSPLRKNERTKKSPVKYSFIDTQLETKAKLGNLSNLSRALNHAENLAPFDLVILAKGLGFRNVDTMEIEDLRADVMTFAANPATMQKYLNAVDSNLVRTEGRIQNLVDKGVFMLKEIGQVRQWYWNEGERRGQPIGEQILSSSMDALTTLKTYILHNMEHYESAIVDYNGILAARQSAESHFETKAPVQKSVVPDYLPGATEDDGEPDEDERTEFQKLIHDFHSAKAYIGEKGFPRTPGQIKIFENAVAEGEVDEENAMAYLTELFRK